MLGLGNVGAGVAAVLFNKSEQLAASVGRGLQLQRALVRDPKRPRPIAPPPGVLTTDPQRIVAADDIDVVIELLGGLDPARELIEASIANGKHVVTANKEVMAHHGAELLAHAAERGVDLYFEASVGAGIPLIGPFRQNLTANQFSAVEAIINGTTNYILTRMAAEGSDFGAVLADAQRLGYAEPDPANDIEGHDAAYKLAVLATLAFGIEVRPESIFREGIAGLAAADFRAAADLGYGIKLLAIARLNDGAVEARVHPTMIPRECLLCQVGGVENAVRIQGDLIGNATFVGRGAGPEPTASAIVADLIDLAHNLALGAHARVPLRVGASCTFRPIERVRSRYYLRLWVKDQPGVLAQIGSVFGAHEVSIAAVTQKETDDDASLAELVIVTHQAVEKDMQAAVAEAGGLGITDRIATLIRIEDIS